MLTEDQVRAIYAESMKYRDPVPYIHQAIEAAVLAELAKQEPVGYQFQGRDGTWHQFTHERHYAATVKDGTWPIRAIYAAPVVQPDDLKDAEKERDRLLFAIADHVTVRAEQYRKLQIARDALIAVRDADNNAQAIAAEALAQIGGSDAAG